MPTNYTSRLTLILVVLIGALWLIFPHSPTTLFNPSIPFSEKQNLKPGIDMVGGTSLLYEIKVPEGGYHGQHTLAEDVMESLKKRVDPDGVRNLIWRPQGENRLEIQMPLSGSSAQSKQRKDEFLEAPKNSRAKTATSVSRNSRWTARLGRSCSRISRKPGTRFRQHAKPRTRRAR